MNIYNYISIYIYIYISSDFSNEVICELPHGKSCVPFARPFSRSPARPLVRSPLLRHARPHARPHDRILGKSASLPDGCPSDCRQSRELGRMARLLSTILQLGSGPGRLPDCCRPDSLPNFVRQIPARSSKRRPDLIALARSVESNTAHPYPTCHSLPLGGSRRWGLFLHELRLGMYGIHCSKQFVEFFQRY